MSKYSKDDIPVIRAKYFYKNQTALNLDNPKEFMEKIQWLKLFHYKEEYSKFVDKIDVRSYVERKIGKQYLNEIIGIYDSVDEIDFQNLPNQYVAKGTHGSGYNIIVKDNSVVEIDNIKRKLKSYLKGNYYYRNRELVYKNINPRILIEKYISDTEDSGIIDYKFYCFHGQPKYILVKRNENGIEKKAFYDLQWNRVFCNKNPSNFIDFQIQKPVNFDKMLELAAVLSKEFIFIRVDLYSVVNSIIFGELTFFPGGGNRRLPIDYLNQEMGDLINLPILE
ncbi:ATP-grasp fold amidoligase family protein [Flavobacterium flavipallidum]|uniref:ATP-grasp fold amidoligase family protein n=1 Tax=Flavobacterium flavipallidum TaxID=3139140 RepID=UPI00311F7F82